MSRRRVLTLGSSAAAVAALATWRFWPFGPLAQSVAVLEFANPAADPGLAHVCQGLTRALIERLGPLPSVRVLPYSLVANLRGRDADARVIGRDLGVEAVLAGSLTRGRAGLSATASLIDVATGKILWSNSYERETDDVIVLQDWLARAIVDDGIRLRVTADDRRQLFAHETSDPLAYDLFLRAVSLHELGTEEGYLQERQLLRQALERDSSFARAYAKLASTFTVMAIDGYEPPHVAGPQVIANVRQALKRDSGLPDAHAEAAAWEFSFNWNWESAAEQWTRAMQSRGAEIDPHLLTSHALQEWVLGRTDSALQIIRQVRTLDPLSPGFMINEADYLRQAGRLDEAISLYEQAGRAQGPDSFAYLGVAEARRAQGRFDEAIAIRRQHADEPALRDVLSRARGAEGYAAVETTTARLQLRTLVARQEAGGYVSSADFARLFARIGHADEAFRQLDIAIGERSPQVVFLDVDGYWDGLRDDARFVDARKRIGLSL
jgi:TolB-like protein